jgi:hypothetical protein
MKEFQQSKVTYNLQAIQHFCVMQDILRKKDDYFYLDNGRRGITEEVCGRKTEK